MRKTHDEDGAGPGVKRQQGPRSEPGRPAPPGRYPGSRAGARLRLRKWTGRRKSTPTYRRRSRAATGLRDVDVQADRTQQRLQLLDPAFAYQFLKSQHDRVSLGFETEDMARFFKQGLRDVEGRSHIKELKSYASRRQVGWAGGAGADCGSECGLAGGSDSLVSGAIFAHFSASTTRSPARSRSQSCEPRMIEASSRLTRSSLSDLG